MPRPRTGGVIFKASPTGKHYKTDTKGVRVRGDWYARIKWRDDKTGKQRSRWRAALNKNDAKDKCRDLADELRKAERGEIETARRPSRLTFDQLADHFERRYLKAAEYVGERKVAGLRSLRTQTLFLSILRAHFGPRPLLHITHGDVEEFKQLRLKSPKTFRFKDEAGEWQERTGGQRALASVHRELALLRRLLTIARREGWIDAHPFGGGDSLISAADETHRQRILSTDEEARLLAACDAPRREHLRPIIICALDTAMRQGEIFSLTWSQVNFKTRTISITAFNTKTLRARAVPISERLARELIALRDDTAEDDDLVFGVSTNVKRSFTGACDDAGIAGLRFHDLRHTAATRLVQHGLSLPELSRILGHTQPNTTYRYVNATNDTIERAKGIFDALNSNPAATFSAPTGDDAHKQARTPNTSTR